MSLIRKIEYLDIDTLKGDMKTNVSYILEKHLFKWNLLL